MKEKQGNQEGDEHDAASQSHTFHDPYAILNVERDADEETIQRSYKRLSRTFHPDKQPPGPARDSAQKSFLMFKNAYDALTDPVQRQAFDDHGVRALEVVRHSSISEKHPDALYATLLRLHQSGQRQTAQLVLKETLQFLEIDASDRDLSFSSAMEFQCTTVSTDLLGEGEERFTAPELHGGHVSFSVSSSSQADSKWSVSMGGSSNVANGKGEASGQMSVGYEPVPDTHINVDVDVGNPYKAAIGTTRAFTNGTVVTSKMSTIPNSRNLSLLFVSQRPLMENSCISTCAFGFGTDLSVQLYQLSFMTLWKDWPRMMLKLKLLDEHPVKVSAKKTFGTQQHKHAAHVSCAFGRSSIVVKTVVDHAVSSYATWSIGLEHASMTGLTWVLGVRRGGISFRVPIHVSNVQSPGYAYKVLLMGFVSALWHSLIRDSVEETASRDIDSQTSTSKEASWIALDKSRRDAEQQSELMKKTADQSKETEKSLRTGLVILRATYSVDGGEAMDATTQLQFWVKNSNLQLPPIPKSHLLGFYSLTAKQSTGIDQDTNWWEPLRRIIYRKNANKELNRPVPKLTVRYEFSGGVYEISVRDDEELILPNPSALCLGNDGAVI